MDNQSSPTGIAGRDKKSLRFTLAVLVGSVLVTIIFWMVLPSPYRVNESSDYALYYEPVARSILTGRGLRLEDGSPAVLVPPGFPLWLAAIFGISGWLVLPAETVLKAGTLLAVGLAAVLLYLIAESTWGRPRAVFTVLVWMTYPLVLWLTKQPNSEVLFTVIFYGGFLAAWHALARSSLASAWVPSLLAGVLFGLAMLVRPIAIGIGLVSAIAFLLLACQKRWPVKLFLVGVLLLGNLSAILPWEIWAHRSVGRILPLGAGGVESFRGGLTFAVNLKGYRQGICVPSDVKALMMDIRKRQDELQTLDDVTSVILEQMEKRPMSLVKLIFIKLGRSWYGTDSQRFETSVLLVQGVYLALVTAAAVFAWKMRGRPRRLFIYLLLLVVYFWIMNVAGLPLARYMVPVTGLLFLLLPALVPGSARAQTRLIA